MSVNEKMTAIADNIRDKTGTAEPLTLDDMASGVNEVYNAGIDEGTLNFINLLTNNGTRSGYIRFFSGTDFSDYTFPETLYPRSIGRMFYDYRGTKIPKGLDCGNAHTGGGSEGDSVVALCGYSTELVEFPDINIPAMGYWYQAFYGCSKLEKIEKMRLAKTPVATTMFNGTFQNCTSLKSVTFEGEIQCNINFAQSPLTIECMKHTIMHLKDYSADTDNKGKYTLTLKDSCKTLMAEQGAIEEFDGKTYDAYIADTGWNLA
jgi:hypothetical protein